MSRKKKADHHEEESSETWLLPYSDLLTLLLALFIVLYSTSSVDAEKFQALSKVFGEIFSSGTGIMDYPATESEEAAEEDEQDITTDTTEEITQEEQSAEQEALTEIQDKINTYISSKDLSNDLQTSLTSEGLLVTIKDSVLFDSGSANVREEDIQVAKEISDLLVIDPPHNIIISGHTDNVPIKNSTFGSNWELSVMRAVNFMKIILENENLDPSHFSAKGYGEFSPIASNDTDEGRKKNRRVEVLIMPNTELNTEN